MTVPEKNKTFLVWAPEKAQHLAETLTPPLPALEIAAVGRKYTTRFTILVTKDVDLTRDINRRTELAWGCFKKFSTELFERPSAPLRLKCRLLVAGGVVALLCGCMT